MDFYIVLEEVDEGLAFNPYAGKKDDQWIEGFISVDFLNNHFGHLKTAEEMINATESEGLKKYFVWLQDKNILN